MLPDFCDQALSQEGVARTQGWLVLSYLWGSRGKYDKWGETEEFTARALPSPLIPQMCGRVSTSYMNQVKFPVQKLF